MRDFIDYNKQSSFHEDVQAGYGCYCLDEKLYKEIYDDRYTKYKDSINLDPTIYEGLLGDWIPISKYKNEFYFSFTICEFQRRGFTLSDTAVVTYSMDGPTPQVLLDIAQTENELTIKTSNETYLLKRVNNTDEIYSFEGRYLIHNSHLNSYPIIVTDCHELR